MIRPLFVMQVIGWVLLALIALVVVERGRHSLELIVLAIVLATLLRGPIDALDRRVPRWAAITIVTLGGIATVGGVLAIGTIQLNQEIDGIREAVDRRIDSIDATSSIGKFVADAHVAERVDSQLDRLPSKILIGSPAPSAGARLGLEALLVIVLTLYALVNGPRLVRGAEGDRPAWWLGCIRQGVGDGARQVRRIIGIAGVSGTIGLFVAWAFGLPGTTVLGIWIGLWSAVPIFGPVVGYAPLVVLASIDGWPNAVGVGVVTAVVTVASWYLDRPRPRAASVGVRIGPFGLAIALVIGLRFGWLTGPLVSIFVIAALVSSLAAFAAGRSRRPEAEPLPEPAPARTAATSAAAGSVWSRLQTRSAATATAIVVAAIVLAALIVDLSPVPVWIAVGLTLAVALDPLVGWLAAHTVLGRSAAIATVVVGFLALVSLTVVFAVPSVAQSVRDLDEQLPQIAADLEQLPLIGGMLADRGIADRLQTTVEGLPDRLSSDTGPLEGALRSVGDGLVATFWVLLITVTGLVDGDRARRGLRRLFRPHAHDEFDRVDSTVRRVIARYAVGSVSIAALAGTAVFLIALVAGVPLAPLLGLWAAISNFIPQVGGYIGGLPLVVLALTLGGGKGVIVLVVYVVYMQIENRIIQPVIVGKAVDISPFVAMVAVLIGGAAGGVVGAVLVTPLVGVAKALHAEFAGERRSTTDRPGPASTAGPAET